MLCGFNNWFLTNKLATTIRLKMQSTVCKLSTATNIWQLHKGKAMLITIKECDRLPLSVKMTIRSNGYFVYSVEFSWHGNRKLFSDDGEQVKTFHNVTSIKDCFRHLPLEEATLVHVSAYDEMVGQAISVDNELTVPIRLKTMY